MPYSSLPIDREIRAAKTSMTSIIMKEAAAATPRLKDWNPYR
jgi:hypothetical protein